MTMLELGERQRAVRIEKLPDLANIAAGALAFGQVLGERRPSAVIALIGISVWFVLMGVAVALARKDER